MSERYSFSLTTFNPSGKLIQIEYALKAVAAGAQSVGIKTKECVVLASDKKQRNNLYDESTLTKLERVTDTIGMTYSGLGPDYRLLVKNARKAAEEYKLIYNEPIPTPMLVQKVATVMQEFTQAGGVRPFGVSVLIAGFDEETEKAHLFQVDPSGSYFPWKAAALGKNETNTKNFLQKRYNEELGVDDIIHTAILALKEGFEGAMTEDNIQLGICDKSGYRPLTTTEIADALAAVTH